MWYTSPPQKCIIFAKIFIKLTAYWQCLELGFASRFKDLLEHSRRITHITLALSKVKQTRTWQWCSPCRECRNLCRTTIYICWHLAGWLRVLSGSSPVPRCTPRARCPNASISYKLCANHPPSAWGRAQKPVGDIASYPLRLWKRRLSGHDNQLTCTRWRSDPTWKSGVDCYKNAGAHGAPSNPAGCVTPPRSLTDRDPEAVNARVPFHAPNPRLIRGVD